MEQKLTFGEFDELLNRWIVETIEMNKVYFHQCDDVQWMFFKVKFNLSKITSLKYKISVLNVLLAILEENIRLTEDVCKASECALTNMEKAVECICISDPPSTEDMRNNAYRNAERIGEIITQMKCDCEVVNEKIQAYDKAINCGDPNEYFAKIMASHLYLLEGIEASYHQLLSILRETERKFKSTNISIAQNTSVSSLSSCENCLCHNDRKGRKGITTNANADYTCDYDDDYCAPTTSVSVSCP